MEAALVSVSMGVMKPLLSKLTKLLEGEYIKVKGVRKQIKFLTDELSAMSATLQMLADAEQLNPQMREWRDRLRVLAYDLEDCVDAFMIRVDGEHDGGSSFKRFFRKLRKLKACHEIANEIEELKACVIEASERHKRYAFAQSTHDSSISSIDPRLPALYVDIEKLVGMDGPKKHIIERLTMEMEGSSTEVKVVSIYGCGGLGKTALANQVYQAIKRHFLCATFVSVSRNPNMTKILRDITEELGFTSTPDE
jgi:ATP-dependent Lon protease